MNIAKADDPSSGGYFEGYASTFGNIDVDNDVIKPGAFMASLEKNNNTFKLFYGHDYSLENFIGSLMAKEDEKGLFVKGEVDLDDPMGKKAFKLLKSGMLDKMSIGFRVESAEFQEDDGTVKRVIKEADLMEVSLVPFPANDQAKITNVKNLDKIKTIRDAELCLRDLGMASKQSQKLISLIKGFDQSLNKDNQATAEETDHIFAKYEDLLNE